MDLPAGTQHRGGRAADPHRARRPDAATREVARQDDEQPRRAEAATDASPEGGSSDVEATRLARRLPALLRLLDCEHPTPGRTGTHQARRPSPATSAWAPRNRRGHPRAKLSL